MSKSSRPCHWSSSGLHPSSLASCACLERCDFANETFCKNKRNQSWHNVVCQKQLPLVTIANHCSTLTCQRYFSATSFSRANFHWLTWMQTTSGALSPKSSSGLTRRWKTETQRYISVQKQCAQTFVAAGCKNMLQCFTNNDPAFSSTPMHNKTCLCFEGSHRDSYSRVTSALFERCCAQTTTLRLA